MGTPNGTISSIMGQPHPPKEWKLLCGYLGPEGRIEEAVRAMEAEFGKTDFRTIPVPFTQTRYYEEEMGTGLFRTWFSFAHLVDPGCLASVKHLTNHLETRFTDGKGNRTINLDPGLLDEYRLVLASTKEGPHRIYLGQGIYAEVTLLYKKGEYRELYWTYPDYAEYRQVFLEIRQILLNSREG